MEKAKILGWREIVEKKSRKEQSAANANEFSPNQIAVLWLLVMGLLGTAAFYNQQQQRPLEKVVVGDLPDPKVQQQIKEVTIVIGLKYREGDHWFSASCNGPSLQSGIVASARHCVLKSEYQLKDEIKVSKDGGNSWFPSRSVMFSSGLGTDYGEINYNPVVDIPKAPIAELGFNRGETVYIQSYLSRDSKMVPYLTPVEVLGYYYDAGDIEMVLADPISNNGVGLVPGRSGSGVFTKDGEVAAVLTAENDADATTKNFIQSYGFDEKTVRAVGYAHVLRPTWQKLVAGIPQFLKRR